MGDSKKSLNECLCQEKNPHGQDIAFLGRWGYFLFQRFYLFLEIENGKERETLMRKRNIDGLPLAHPQMGTWPATQACALTGNRTSDPLLCSLVLNSLSHTSQGMFPIF